MTDDSDPRYRPKEPFERDRPSNSLASDPLAELARLIGQTQPFAELGGRGQGHGEASSSPHEASSSRQQDARYHDDPQPLHDDRPPLDDDRLPRDADREPFRDDRPTDLPPWPPSTRPRDFDDEPDVAANDDTSFLRREFRDLLGRSEPRFDSVAPTAFGRSDPRGYDAEPEGRPRDLPGFELPDLPGFPRSGEPTDPPIDPLGLAGQEPPPLFASRDLPQYVANDLAGYSPPPSPDYREGDVPQPHDDEFYNNAPPNRSRKGMVTVLAVLGLAVIGTAGAFAYRTLIGGPKVPTVPPVIRASSEPNKVAPPPTSNEATSKLSYDRFGDRSGERSQNEQVVVREEKPVDTREFARSSGPRVVFPGAPIPSNSGNAGGNSLSVIPPSTRTPSGTMGEPRRVRTMPIRPDQPDSAARPGQMPALPGGPDTAMAPANGANNGAPSAEVAEEPPSAPPSPPPVRARAAAPRQVAAPRPAPPPSGANAPLSLAPNATADLPPPARAAAPPTRVASVPSGSGYLVQVSSQRSEADAQAAYRTLRARYSSVLGSLPSVIRRADLGSRGIFYRAMVGPFGSREEAIQICGNLKAAGGDCVVQSN